MQVIHLALSPLAGSPIRIVNALNRHTQVRARLVVLDPDRYGTLTFEGDLNWKNDREEALAILEAADIVHLHNNIDPKANPFGIDFTDYAGRGTAFVRQYHTMPYALARRSHRHEEDIVNDPLPQLVVAQFQERYYPRARPVPNIVPINEELYTPTRKGGSGVTVFFAPSNIRSAWQVPDALSRWDTKGFPETLALLKRIERATPGVRIDVGLKLPHAECLARRRHSHVSIDEMVTGSYHLSSLESLSQGVPTFAFLDRRTQVTLAEITGTGEHPWMDFRLEEAEIPLRRLLEDAELREEVGRYSRQWMEQYWDDVAMVRHFVRAYEDLLERPGVFQKMRFDPSDGKAMWFGRGMDDASWEARRTRHVQCGIWRTIRAGLGVRRREL